MPVIWRGRGDRMTDIGMAVGCGLCGAEAGTPCVTRTFPLGRHKTHQQRRDMAEAFGFVLVADNGVPVRAPKPVTLDMFPPDREAVTLDLFAGA